MTNIHELKILPEFFEAVLIGKKTCELRKADRNFAVGDLIKLNEWDGEHYTGRNIVREITHIIKDYLGLTEGFCILSLKSIYGDGLEYRIKELEAENKRLWKIINTNHDDSMDRQEAKRKGY